MRKVRAANRFRTFPALPQCLRAGLRAAETGIGNIRRTKACPPVIAANAPAIDPHAGSPAGFLLRMAVPESDDPGRNPRSGRSETERGNPTARKASLPKTTFPRRNGRGSDELRSGYDQKR